MTENILTQELVLSNSLDKLSIISEDLLIPYTGIGENAFRSCHKLSEIHIPKTITTIGRSAFLDCKALKVITVSDENLEFSSIDGVLFSRDKKTLICFPPNKIVKVYYIPDGVVTIATEAFYNVSSLISINDIECQVPWGFNKNNLMNLIIPNTLKSIGKKSFAF
jgi:hypothetical protein